MRLREAVTKYGAFSVYHNISSFFLDSDDSDYSDESDLVDCNLPPSHHSLPFTYSNSTSTVTTTVTATLTGILSTFYYIL